MIMQGNDNFPASSDKPDLKDIQVGIFVGVAFAVIKFLKLKYGLNLGNLDTLIPFLVCILYIVFRARRDPEKLDEWGITKPVNMSAAFVFVLITGMGIGGLAAFGLLLSDSLSFEFRYVKNMVEYIPAAFPQQFFLCSVGLVSFSKMKIFHGNWRLPIVIGLFFALAHFWTPFHIPGTRIPLQVIGTFPAGFLAAWYFLRFRNILPLTLSHVMIYVLLHNWVEVYL